jgi:hypothetical protein
MEQVQTPTFRCLKAYKPLGSVKGNIIKMSPSSLKELDEDERFTGWKDNFEAIGLEEELSLIRN